MRTGQLEELAGALAERIGTAIQLRCKRRLARFDGKTDAKKHVGSSPAVDRPSAECIASVDGVTAETLNDHYAAISTDNNYTAAASKQPTMLTTTTMQTALVSDW